MKSSILHRRRVGIKLISDLRLRHVTFKKRKAGLFKKAYELSVLCECEVALIVFYNGRLLQYSSGDMDDLLRRYAHEVPGERRTNKDFLDDAAQSRASPEPGESSTATTRSGAPVDDEGGELVVGRTQQREQAAREGTGGLGAGHAQPSALNTDPSHMTFGTAEPRPLHTTRTRYPCNQANTTTPFYSCNHLVSEYLPTLPPPPATSSNLAITPGSSQSHRHGLEQQSFSVPTCLCPITYSPVTAWPMPPYATGQILEPTWRQPQSD